MTPPKRNRPAATRASAPKKKRAQAKKRPARGAATPLDRVREICLALPQAQEVESWGAPTFRVNNKIFAMYSASSHHSAGRVALWMMSVSVEQDFVIRARPDCYFKPPYVGPNGWIGAWLDQRPRWEEIAELIRDAYRRRAPKKLASLLD